MDSSRRISLATRTHSHAKTELIYLNDAVQCVRRHWKCLYNLSTATIDLVLVTQQSQCHLVDCEGTVQHVATKCRSRGPTIQKASTAEPQPDNHRSTTGQTSSFGSDLPAWVSDRSDPCRAFTPSKLYIAMSCVDHTIEKGISTYLPKKP